MFWLLPKILAVFLAVIVISRSYIDFRARVESLQLFADTVGLMLQSLRAQAFDYQDCAPQYGIEFEIVLGFLAHWIEEDFQNNGSVFRFSYFRCLRVELQPLSKRDVGPDLMFLLVSLARTLDRHNGLGCQDLWLNSCLHNSRNACSSGSLEPLLATMRFGFRNRVAI